MRFRVLLAYAALYIVWGSTYLAMKIAVQTVPPFLGASSRFFFSGLVLLFIGRRLSQAPITRAHLVTAAMQGALLMVVSNGSVMWAMKTVPSSTGALLIATTPVFLTLISGEKRPITWLGIAVSSVGIAILVNPFSSTREIPLLGAAVIILAAISWSVGSLLPRFRPAHPDTATSTALQMISGAVIHLLMSLALGEPRSTAGWSFESSWALVYLSIFGSLVGFSAYTWLLRVEPPARVATYAYVNPVVAMILGAAVGREVIGPRVIVAAAVIVAGVVVIVRWGRQKAPPSRA